MRVHVQRVVTVVDDAEVFDYIIADRLRPYVLRYVHDGDAVFAELDVARLAVDRVEIVERALSTKRVIVEQDLTSARESLQAEADTAE